MKVSEITLEYIIEYTRIDVPDETEQKLLDAIKAAAVSYASSYTGLNPEELDQHEDIAIAVLALISDMYDNRSVSVKETGVNRIVESILGMHSVNLL